MKGKIQCQEMIFEGYRKFRTPDSTCQAKSLTAVTPLVLCFKVALPEKACVTHRVEQTQVYFQTSQSDILAFQDIRDILQRFQAFRDKTLMLGHCSHENFVSPPYPWLPTLCPKKRKYELQADQN